MNRILCIIVTAVFCFLLFFVLPVNGQNEQKKVEWAGKRKDGVPITIRDMHKIISEHQKWFKTGNKEGKRANLSGAHLREADLSGTHLREAILYRALLSKADLRETDLSGTDLSGASLGYADLRRAILFKVKLSEAYLYYANLSNAIMIRVRLFCCDLKTA